ncbi:hypothetical protein B0H19DRAFT_1252172 [Mycena capillaripes]|nr:hypothetical protein B0H19DRAFT_1252172 [Mycena capillaripes]
MARENAFQKTDDLWFSPDVIILRASTRLFRVFAAILKVQSSVFADMFTFPQPPASSADMETMDGFPVVEVHDKPEDMEVFLKAIFDSSFFMPPPAEMQLEKTLGILRLSHKYDVLYLCRRALEHLGTIYHTRLSGYLTRANSNNSEIDDHKTFILRIDALKTASEVGALWLLPMVYYEICKQDLALILAPNSAWHELGEKERTSCLVGHSAQITQFPKILNFLSVGKTEDSDCEDWMECNAIRFRTSFAINDGLESSMRCPLDLWDETEWGMLKELGLCNSCLAEAKDLQAAARQKLWDRLPQMFGLPKWEELEELKRVAFLV